MNDYVVLSYIHGVPTAMVILYTRPIIFNMNSYSRRIFRFFWDSAYTGITWHGAQINHQHFSRNSRVNLGRTRAGNWLVSQLWNVPLYGISPLLNEWPSYVELLQVKYMNYKLSFAIYSIPYIFSRHPVLLCTASVCYFVRWLIFWRMIDCWMDWLIDSVGQSYSTILAKVE